MRIFFFIKSKKSLNFFYFLFSSRFSEGKYSNKNCWMFGKFLGKEGKNAFNRK